MTSLRASQVETLRTLAEVVDKEGVWVGSRWELALERGLSEYTVRDHLQRLEGEGLLLRKRRIFNRPGTTFYLTPLGKSVLEEEGA